MAVAAVSTYVMSGTKGRKVSLVGLPVPGFVDFLVIAGGGGSTFGRGGAGGYRTSYGGGSGLSGRGSSLESGITINEGTAYTVTVGGGGAAGSGVDRGTNGANSTFSSVTSSGGGAGGGSTNHTEKNGRNGGAGGGAGYYYGGGAGGSGTANQGYNGASTAADFARGDGGGAGGTPAGLASTITGSSVTRAVGGASGTPQSANSGNGAIDTRQNGNSGVVILRFEGKQPSISAGLSYSIVKDGTANVIQFTSGTGTVTW